jgi:hypothetical protein
MDAVTLGMTGLKVSGIAYGVGELGGGRGSFDEHVAIATVRHPRECGIASSLPRRPTDSVHPNASSAERCATISTGDANRSRSRPRAVGLATAAFRHTDGAVSDSGSCERQVDNPFRRHPMQQYTLPDLAYGH